MLTKLSFRYVWKKKSRSLIVVVALCLASFLFCSILLISGGLIRTIQSDAKHRYGSYTICMAYADGVEQQDFIRQTGDHDPITKNLEGYISQDIEIYSIWSVSDSWYECFDCEISVGRYPSQPGEIMVPNDVDAFVVGSTVTAEMFLRFNENGEQLDERIAFSDIETRKVVDYTEYTVVGAYINDGRACIRSNNTLCLYTFKESDQDLFSFIYSEVENSSKWEQLELQYSDSVFINRDYLTTIGYSGSGESILQNIIFLCVALIFLVAVAILILIGNAFALSYREQLREFGILSSAGATSNQIKRLFLLEAFWLSLCGIIIGIVISVICVMMCISYIAPYILSMCYVSTEFVMPTLFQPICISVVLTLVVALTASHIPIVTSRHKTQIELMRENFSFRKSKRFTSVSKHKIENFLSERYRLSNLPRFWTVVSSLGVSTMILLLALGICNAEITANEQQIQNKPYDIMISMETENVEEFHTMYQKLMTEKTVDSKRAYRYLTFADFTNVELSGVLERDAYAIAIPDDKFRMLVNCDNSIPDVIAAQNTIRYSVNGKDLHSESVSLFQSPSTVMITGKDANSIVVCCIPWQTLCTIYPCFRDVEQSLLIYPETSSLLINQTIDSGHIYLFADDHKSICEAYEANSQLSVMNLAADYDQQKTSIIIIKFFLYLFMTIIFFVCFINMFFTIYCSHKLREREYLVLQTIGMVPKQSRQMIMYECVKSCIITILISCTSTFLIAAIVKYVVGIRFVLPLTEMFHVFLLTLIAHIISFFIVNQQISNINMLEGIRKNS